jgi:hypothetical protein
MEEGIITTGGLAGGEKDDPGRLDADVLKRAPVPLRYVADVAARKVLGPVSSYLDTSEYSGDSV